MQRRIRELRSGLFGPPMMDVTPTGTTITHASGKVCDTTNPIVAVDFA